MRPITRVILWLVMLSIMSCGFEETSSGPSVSGSVPATPTEMVITTGDKQVTVRWKEAAGASSYNLYWSQIQGVSPATGTKIANVSSPYVHTSLTNGATYYYVITSANAYGESGHSAEVLLR